MYINIMSQCGKIWYGFVTTKEIMRYNITSVGNNFNQEGLDAPVIENAF